MKRDPHTRPFADIEMRFWRDLAAELGVPFQPGATLDVFTDNELETAAARVVRRWPRHERRALTRHRGGVPFAVDA
jgi:hypothetical protein